ncbi:hypothetical protein ACS0TY_030426 [Phlomoides rotata]
MSVAFSSYAHSMKIEELRGIIAVLLKLILNLSLFLSLGRVLQSLCIRQYR